MKKINLSNIKDSLTKNELRKIMAGSGDVNNTNGSATCSCEYNNASLTTNTNTPEGCNNCTCKK